MNQLRQRGRRSAFSLAWSSLPVAKPWLGACAMVVLGFGTLSSAIAQYSHPVLLDIGIPAEFGGQPPADMFVDAFLGDLSYDGSVAGLSFGHFGQGTGGLPEQAYRWTSSGFNPLPMSRVLGVSSDGGTMLGSDFSNGLTTRWTLGGVDTTNVLYGTALSSDGLTVYGGNYVMPSWDWASYVWQAPGAPLQIPNYPNSYRVDFWGAGGDFVAGWAYLNDGSGSIRGLLWSRSSQSYTDIPDLPGSVYYPEKAIVYSVTPDGQFAVGESESSLGSEAFVWSAATGTISLNTFGPGIEYSLAEDLSDDGKKIVGTVEGGNPYQGNGFLWEPEFGARDLKTVLQTEYGLDLTGLRITWVRISGNGKALLMRTINEQGLYSVHIAYLTNTRAGGSVEAKVGGGAGTPGGATFEFSNVTVPGETTVTASATGPQPPSGFRLVPAQTYYDISTTAQFTGSVRVCLAYNETEVSNESNLKLMHYENGAWVNITSSLDTVNNVICGVTTSFSPFIIVEQEPLIQVSIDIKPGSSPNSINLGSNGVVPVAIFSTADFDARDVNPLSVKLADAGVKVRGNGTLMFSFDDVNGDGLQDMVIHVSTQGLQLTTGDTQAVLTGSTYEGQQIRGTDSVRVVN